MMFYARELKESERNMRNLAHMPAKGRVAQALLTLTEKFGSNTNGVIDMTLSGQDLASYAGTTYETVLRIMNDLTGENIVSVSGRDITIIDQDKLLELTKATNQNDKR